MDEGVGEVAGVGEGVRVLVVGAELNVHVKVHAKVAVEVQWEVGG